MYTRDYFCGVRFLSTLWYLHYSMSVLSINKSIEYSQFQEQKVMNDRIWQWTSCTSGAKRIISIKDTVSPAAKNANVWPLQQLQISFAVHRNFQKAQMIWGIKCGRGCLAGNDSPLCNTRTLTQGRTQTHILQLCVLHRKVKGKCIYLNESEHKKVKSYIVSLDWVKW